MKLNNTFLYKYISGKKQYCIDYTVLKTNNIKEIGKMARCYLQRSKYLEKKLFFDVSVIKYMLTTDNRLK